MILGQDIFPDRKLYYLGSVVIDVLNGQTGSEFDFFDVYRDVNERSGTSINTFTLTLDWLFMIGVIRFNQGEIEKCF